MLCMNPNKSLIIIKKKPSSSLKRVSLMLKSGLIWRLKEHKMLFKL